MGRKSRAQIKEEFNKQQYFRYVKMVDDPEYKSLWEKLGRVNERLKIDPDDMSSWNQKKSIEKRLRDKYGLAIPDITHLAWEILTEDEKRALELPIAPAKRLSEDEFKYFVEEISPIFVDTDIVKIIPFKEPQLIQSGEPPITKGKKEPSSERLIWSKIDYTGLLQDNRYLTVKIDTWSKRERIEWALAEIFDYWKEQGIIQFKSRLRLTKDEEQIRAMQLRSQGKTYKEIAYDIWPNQFEKEEQKIAKKENVEGEEINQYEQFVKRLLEEGKSMGEAYDEADRKFGLEGKKIVNPLIIKVYYLLSKRNRNKTPTLFLNPDFRLQRYFDI